MDENVDEDTGNFPERINFSRIKILDLMPSNTGEVLFTFLRILSNLKKIVISFGSKNGGG